MIKNIKLYGDFFSGREISELEEKLAGKRYNKDDIKAILLEIDVKSYFSGFELEDILDVII